MRKKDPDKGRQILIAAAKLLLTDGLNAFSTTKVAKALGIAQSNIYLYYPTKHALLQALLTAAQDRAGRAFAAHRPASADLTAQVLAYLDGMIGFASHDPNTFELLHSLKADPSLSPGADPQAPEALLTAASTAGLLRPLPPAVLMAVVFNAIRQTALAGADFAPTRAMLIAALFTPERMPHAD